MVVVIVSTISSSSTRLFQGIPLSFFDYSREQMRMYQQINVLKHLFIAASREENYPVSLKISLMINTLPELYDIASKFTNQ